MMLRIKKIYCSKMEGREGRKVLKNAQIQLSLKKKSIHMYI